jgi:hypothetical protein
MRMEKGILGGKSNRQYKVERRMKHDEEEVG